MSTFFLGLPRDLLMGGSKITFRPKFSRFLCWFKFFICSCFFFSSLVIMVFHGEFFYLITRSFGDSSSNKFVYFTISSLISLNNSLFTILLKISDNLKLTFDIGPSEVSLNSFASSSANPKLKYLFFEVFPFFILCYWFIVLKVSSRFIFP